MNYLAQAFAASGISPEELSRLSGYSLSTLYGSIRDSSCERVGRQRSVLGGHLAEVLDLHPAYLQAWEAEQDRAEEEALGHSRQWWPDFARPVAGPIFLHTPPRFRVRANPKLDQALRLVRRAIESGALARDEAARQLGLSTPAGAPKPSLFERLLPRKERAA